MKKRILSLLIAFVLVASTFIISKPLVDVHAVETPDFTEGVNMWTLEYNWTRNLDPKDANGWELASKNNGIWRLTSFSDPAKISTMRWKASDDSFKLEIPASGNLSTSYNTKSPQSYIESWNNRRPFVGNLASTWDGWYVNYGHRHQQMAFAKGDNSTYMYVVPGNGSWNHAALVFTAPSAGLYDYTEFVEQTAFEYNSAAVTMTATVRKNGVIINAFTPTATTASKTIDGSVYLEKGDLLTFVFSEDTSNSAIADSTKYVKLSNVVVKKTANASSNDSLPLSWVSGCETDANGWALAKQGNWRLTSFDDPSKISTITSWDSSKAYNTGATGSPGPWMNNSQNATTDSFYVNNGGRWSNGTIFNKGVEGEYILAIPYGTHRYDATNGSAALSRNSNPTVLFTAAVAGEYVYSEIIRGATLTDSKGTPVTVTATVRKNGEVLDTVTISADNAYACNAGTVTLNKGDYLMFVFVLDQRDALIKDHSDLIRIYGIDVALVAPEVVIPDELPDVVLPIVFDGASFTDKFGMVELMGYDTTTGAPYKDGIAITTFEGKWYVYEPDGKSTYYGNPGKDNFLWGGNLSTGAITNVGGDFKLANVGSTLVFTAPYDGIFQFESTMTSAWPASNKGAWSDYIIRKADGTILATNNNVDKGNNYGDNTNATTVTATVALTKGEMVYIIRKPTGEGNVNTSCSGAATITITDLEHDCSSATVKHHAPVSSGCEDGNIEYWECACGTLYSDANATTVLTGNVVLPGTGHAAPDKYETSATQHWKTCTNNCGEYFVEKTAHTWENGQCTVCEYKCQHAGASVANCVVPSICPVCASQVAPVNPNNHAMSDTSYTNGNGTHRCVKVCCDTDAVVIENCTYGADGLCTKCGFDGNQLKPATDNKNNAFDNAFNGGNNNVTVTGPANGALDNYNGTVSGTKVEGVEYAFLNIHHDDNGTIFVRHHLKITADIKTVTVTFNGKAVTLIDDGVENYYYFDVTPVVGKFDVDDVISVNGKVNYSVSLYAYIKLGLASSDEEFTPAAKTYLKSLYDLNEAAKKTTIPMLVGMANQKADKGVSGRTGAWLDVYDISTGNMNTPVWSYDTALSSISGFKFRYHPVTGKKVALITVGTQAEMVDYETKTVIWSTNKASNNSHSIDILPNGVIVTGGTVGNSITFFNINGANPSECLLEISYPDAHGVLWDPTHEVVWIAGTNKLSAYRVTLNPNGTVTAVKDEQLSVVTPESGLHDLQPLFGNETCLVVSTATHVYIYDTVTKTFAEPYAGVENAPTDHVKGVGNFINGDMFYMYHDGGNDNGSTTNPGGWNTTYLTYLSAETGVITTVPSNQGRFYKCRVVNFDYQ